MIQSTATQQNVVPASEVFWSLVHKADKKFSKITHIPFYHGNRQHYDAYFYKVFKVYTQVWKFQQENRQKLVEAGLSRAEIGEIASRIAQLYFGQYARSSQADYLREAFVFYDAILSRDYFNSSSDLALASKHLRFLSRFLAVCLLLNRRHFLHHLLSVLRASLEHYSKTFQDTDFKEWKQVVQELVRFLKSDTSFMNIRPLRYSVVLDPDPDSLESPAALRSLRLRDAVLTSYHHNEVKFSEITLDTFRMLQCLEWESSGSFYQPNVAAKGSQNGSSLSSSTRAANHSQDIADPSLPPNPRKAVLYRPTVTHFLAVVATICEELPPDGVCLIYLSGSSCSQAQGTKEVISDVPSISQLHMSERSGPSSGQFNEIKSPIDASCLWFGPRGNEGVNCIYPSDLLPFTRRPVFLVIDGDNNDAFEAIHGSEKGETTAILLSPSISSSCISADSRDHPSGSIFTAFLTAPIQAFCLLLGISGSTVDTDTYLKAENLLSTSLNEWGSMLVSSDTHPVWGQILGDPFLRRLILRFIFCRAVFASYKSSFNKKEFLPWCVPSLPESLLPSSVTCQYVVMKIAEIFGATSSFTICEGIENTHVELELMP